MFGIVRYSFTIVSFCVVVLAGECAFGQVLKGDAAHGSWHDDRPGLRRPLTPTDGLAQVVPIPTAARPTSALRKPRVIREAPNGDLFVADTIFDAVHVLRVPPGSTQPARDEVFAGGLKQPFGIAFYPLGSDPRWVYIANSDGVVRFRYRNGDLKATGKAEQIIAGIPTTHHYARDTGISADGHRLFFSVGSASNAAPMGAAWDNEELRAEVLAYDPDGTHIQIVATGLRNCEGMTVQPATGELWCIVNERDELGDNTPFEYREHTAGIEGSRDGYFPREYKGSAFTRTASDAGESVQAGSDAAKSRDLYIANCSACHQANGEGLPGVFPPLKGSGVVNKDDAVKHIQVVLNGMLGARVGGVVYAATMPPFAGVLSDAEIADIIDYERSSWGNHGTPVTAAQVAAERARAK